MPSVQEQQKNANRAEHIGKVIVATDDVVVTPVPGDMNNVTHQTSNSPPSGGEFQIQAGQVVPIELEAAYRAAVGDSQADSETVDYTVPPNRQVKGGVDADSEEE